MLTVLLNIVFGLISGSASKALDAAEALEQTATNPISQRFRTSAILFFLLTSVFVVAAGVAFLLAPKNIANEILGWTGIACLHASAFCGLRYVALNRQSDSPFT